MTAGDAPGRKDARRRDGAVCDDELAGLFSGMTGPLALAVSGGADSMALMHLAARWVRLARSEAWTVTVTVGDEVQRPARSELPIAAPPWLADVRDADQLEARGGPPPIVVLTVDHGLRDGSSADARFVAAEARKLGLPCRILRWEGPKPTTGVQEAARAARRALLLGVVEDERAWVDDLLACGERKVRMCERSIALAHHADDQAETFLMRLARGSGLDGLSAIRSPETFRDHAGRIGIIMRPLLAVPGARLRATLEAAGLPWREDPSNADRRFERVRVRQALEVLAGLGIDPTAIAASAGRLAAARFGYQSLIADGPARSVRWHHGMMAECDLFRWGPDVSVRLIQSMLAACGGEAEPARLAQVEALVARLASDTHETLGGCRVTTDGASRLRIFREIGRGLPVVELAAGAAQQWDGGRFRIAVDATWTGGPVAVAALGMADWATLKRGVPGLAELRLPAAAVATLPAFRRDGHLLAVPTLERIVAAREESGAVLARSLRRQLGADPAPARGDDRTDLGPDVVPFRAEFTGASRADLPVSFRSEN